MKTYLAGQNVTLIIPMTLRGEPFVPDANSAKLTLRDAAGQVVTGFNAIPLTMSAASTEAAVVIPAAQNDLAGARYAKRTVVVSVTKSLRPITFQQSYRICGWLNTSVTPDAVRNFVGVDEGELPDEAIDVSSAYFQVEDDATAEILEAALAGADAKEKAANDAILAKTVLALIPSLPLRLSQSETDGMFKAQRPPINLEQLELRAQQLYSDSLTVFSSRFTAENDLLLVQTLSPDPATGA